MGGKVVFLVFGDHNRRGGWLAGAYDNEHAAMQHKMHLDHTQDGWENFSGGRVKVVTVEHEFHMEGL